MEHIYLHAWNVVAAELTFNVRRLSDAYDSYENAWKYADPEKLKKIFPKISEKVLERKRNTNPEMLYEKLTKDFRLIMHEDPDYPILLKEISKSPTSLYVRGSFDQKNYFLSIVGTRRNSHYGEAQTRNIIRSLKNYPFSIISGFAYGIDMIAHKTALEENLPTIAVLPFGFYRMPLAKIPLARKIIEKSGAIISEYAPNTGGQIFHFHQRNRIIAGLSKATVVIEAPQSSGALITTSQALQANREVFAIPGDIDREQSRGCNELIQKQGATPLLNPLEILHAYHLQPQNQQPELFLNLPSDQQEVYEKLSMKDPKTFDQLVFETEKETSHLLTILSILEIEKRIKRTYDGYIIN